LDWTPVERAFEKISKEARVVLLNCWTTLNIKNKSRIAVTKIVGYSTETRIEWIGKLIRQYGVV